MPLCVDLGGRRIIKNAEIINIKGKNELQNAINKELGLSLSLIHI